MRSLALLPLVPLFACASNTQTNNWAALPKVQKQEALDAVTHKCGLPNDRLQMLGGNQVSVRADPRDRYESIDCLLAGLKSLRGIELGFIGNEAYGNEN